MEIDKEGSFEGVETGEGGFQIALIVISDLKGQIPVFLNPLRIFRGVKLSSQAALNIDQNILFVIDTQPCPS